MRFIISGEISTIYKKGGRTRKVHHLILLPHLEAAEALSRRLEGIGNLHSDGRPILGLDSRQLLEMTLEACPEAVFIPAHIWTPHFSLFGANSGFDSIEECFEDLAGFIYAVETGLSSDPPMNWRLSALDRFTLVSNSDAHSPRHLAREANIFKTGLSYPAIRRALQEREAAGFLGTLEFFPEEGKYHYDGHRACNICWPPPRTRAAGGVCPACGRKVTVGVLHRVEELADRQEGFRPQDARPYESLVPLPEVLASALGVGAASKKVTALYFDLLRRLGPELVVLREAPLEAIARVAGAAVAEAIRRMRAGEVETQPGFDGEYGRIFLLRPEERTFFCGQATLFETEETAAVIEAAVTEKAPPVATGQETPAAAGIYSAPATGQLQLHFFRSKDPTTGEGSGIEGGSPEEITPVTAVCACASLPGAGEEIAAGYDNDGSISAIKAPVEGQSRVDTPAAATGGADVLAGLNDEQRQAVTAPAGPVIVVAGPGTGKTRTLVYRLAYLIGQRGVAPGNITAVTFTNKAAGEIRQRVAELLGETGGSEGLTIGTFHSICLGILQEYMGTADARPAGFTGKEQPVILDETDARGILAEVLQEKGVAGSRQALKLQRQISYFKSRGLLPASPGVPEELRPVYRTYQERLEEYGVLDYDDLLLQALEYMQGRLSMEGYREADRFLARFSHLLVDEFQDVNPVQYRLIRLWAGDGGNLFVIGDPDQAIYGFRGASNLFFGQLQKDYPVARLFRLTCNYRSTPVILRAATAVIAHNPDIKPEFSGELPRGAGAPFPNHENTNLGVVDKARADITEARRLVATRKGGPPVLHLEVPGETAEGIAIVREIGRLVGGATMLQAHGQGVNSLLGSPNLRGGEALGFTDIAVLARTGRQLDLLEECFLKEGIPYRVLGRGSFLEDEPVREALAFGWCVANPEDDFHLLRYLGSGHAGLRREDIALVRRISRQAGVSVWGVIAELSEGEIEDQDQPGRAGMLTFSTVRCRGASAGGRETTAAGLPLKPAARKRLLDFKNHIESYRALMDKQPPAGLLAHWVEKQNLKGRESLNRLLRVAERFNDLPSFLRGVALGGEADHERYGGNATFPEAVNLMTIHAAKGLEFPVVFIAGVEDGLLPLREHQEATLDEAVPQEELFLATSHGREPEAAIVATGAAGCQELSLAEERRLFYVGLTRAREMLILVTARKRELRGARVATRPSPFLLEIPADCLQKKTWGDKMQYRQLTLF
ncbi:MAG: UvrD-helicase domain-containing protein [Moorella sp. (in: Bacteria)]|nr:UvrD-helicase domain-containing protein [Moorella sp. (in: firmicutes)]